jgi:hypothetical protein
MDSSMINIDGKAITAGLRAFNEWRDEFLIEASTLFLMIGFAAGTVDVFTKGGLSASYDFTVAWAAVQAVAIDGLFFAVWGKVARASWDRATWFKNTMLILVGLLLAIVATLVNGILSYQELMNISDVKEAMARLGVDQALFTYARSVLVVLVAILVALFCRSKATVGAQDSPAIETEIARSPEPVQITETTEDSPGLPTAITEQAESVDHSLDDIVRSPEPIAHSDGDVAHSLEPRSPAMVAPEDSPVQATQDSMRSRIRAVILIAHQSGEQLSYADIASRAGAGYSTVKKHASTLYEELGIARRKNGGTL